MGKVRKCKKCGRAFEPKDSSDVFCSQICRMTGFFVGGGGDTSKPGTVKQPTNKPKGGAAPARVNNGDEKFARVREMLKLSPLERWNIAKDFTAEEQAYCRRLARRLLMEENRIERETSWNLDETEDSSYGDADEPSGDSDDGTI